MPNYMGPNFASRRRLNLPSSKTVKARLAYAFSTIVNRECEYHTLRKSPPVEIMPDNKNCQLPPRGETWGTELTCTITTKLCIL